MRGKEMTLKEQIIGCVESVASSCSGSGGRSSNISGDCSSSSGDSSIGSGSGRGRGSSSGSSCYWLW